MTPKQGIRRQLAREDWIAIARKVLIAEGIDAVKIDRLAKKLGVTRGGFYWHFKNRDDLLDALIEHWRQTNTASIVATLGGPGAPAERFRALMLLWLEERDYSPDFDTAVRDWARVSRTTARLVHAVDDERIDAFRRLFADAGYPADEAFIRARITYFHQVGYYAMGVHESPQRRQILSELYYKVLTGFP
jgi:AcrR family transcriptional regulator